MVVVTVNSVSYHMNDKLKKLWDKLREGRLKKRDEDRAYIVDGREGDGKSVFAIQQAAYLDPTFCLDRICFTPEEFVKAIENGKPGQAIVFDEAFRGLSSAAARSKVNLMIKNALMEMRQRNLFVFIVLPSFFLLDIYAAMLRSNALFHVCRNKKGYRGYYRVYNYKKKGLLYQIGLKRGWSYSNPKTRFKGTFSDRYPIDQDAYKAKKSASLQDLTLASQSVKEDKYLLQRDLLINALHEAFIPNTAALARWLTALGIEISQQMVSKICVKHANVTTNHQQINTIFKVSSDNCNTNNKEQEENDVDFSNLEDELETPNHPINSTNVLNVS